MQQYKGISEIIECNGFFPVTLSLDIYAAIQGIAEINGMDVSIAVVEAMQKWLLSSDSQQDMDTVMICVQWHFLSFLIYFFNPQFYFLLLFIFLKVHFTKCHLYHTITNDTKSKLLLDAQHKLKAFHLLGKRRPARICWNILYVIS